MKFSNHLLWVLGILAIVAAIPASVSADGSASSADYSFDYATVSAGGTATLSGDYDVIGVLIVDGVADNRTSSASYDTQPIVGVDLSMLPVTISSWFID